MNTPKIVESDNTYLADSISTHLYSKLPVINAAQFFETRNYYHLFILDKQAENKMIVKTNKLQPNSEILLKNINAPALNQMTTVEKQNRHEKKILEGIIKKNLIIVCDIINISNTSFTNYEKILILTKNIRLLFNLFLYNV